MPFSKLFGIVATIYQPPYMRFMSTLARGSVSEWTASTRMGESAGLTLR